MSMSQLLALIIPWLFWGILMGLLIVAGRSWINMLIFPVGITILILATAGLASDQQAFWASLILHILLLLFFTGSYILFLLKARNKDN